MLRKIPQHSILLWCHSQSIENTSLVKNALSNTSIGHIPLHFGPFTSKCCNILWYWFIHLSHYATRSRTCWQDYISLANSIIILPCDTIICVYVFIEILNPFNGHRCDFLAKYFQPLYSESMKVFQGYRNLAWSPIPLQKNSLLF